MNLKHKGEHLKLSPFTVTVRIKENNEEDLPPPVLPDIPFVIMHPFVIAVAPSLKHYVIVQVFVALAFQYL